MGMRGKQTFSTIFTVVVAEFLAASNSWICSRYLSIVSSSCLFCRSICQCDNTTDSRDTDLILQCCHGFHLLLILLNGCLSFDEFLCFVSVEDQEWERRMGRDLATSSSSAICNASTSNRVRISSLSSIRLDSDWFSYL
jgi:hypothetical protein